MGLYRNLLKYQLNQLNEEQESLFTYFDIRYELNSDDESNPSIVISLYTKYRNIELAHLYIDFKGEEEYRCYFCSHSRCVHLQLLVTKILQNPDIVNKIKELDDYAENHEYRKQQEDFNNDIKEIFDDIFNEEKSSLIHLAHLTPYLEDVRNAYALELKVGINKSYKIPSIYQFLNRFKHKEVYQYGKELKIIHRLNNFDEPSHALINYLRDNIENITQYPTLKPKAVDSLCEIYLNQEIYVDNEPYLVSDQSLNIKFHVDNNYKIHFTCEETDYKPFGELFYINRHNGMIKRLVSDPHLLVLIHSLEKYPLANIKSRFFEFKYTYFLKYPSLFSFDEEVERYLNQEPLKIKSYFDYDKENDVLTVDSHFFKEEIEINKEDITSPLEKRMINKYQEVLTAYGFVDNQISNSADIFNFINGSLEDIRLLSEVYVSDTLAKMNVITFSGPSIRITREGSMLDVFMGESEFNEEELRQIFQALKKKKKYILIKDNFIDLSTPSGERFFETVDNFELLSNKSILKSQRLPLYYAFKNINEDNPEIEVDSLIEDVFNQLKGFSNNKLVMPKINGKLRGYQKDGVKWLNVLYQNGLGGILADDMGLGKTIEAITFIKIIQKDAPILIVCPKSLIFNWQSEFKRFAPELPTFAIHGTVNERKKVISGIKDNTFGVYFISYDSLRNEVDNLKGKHFDMCILDEAQFIKNAFAKKTSAVKSINADHLFALTGTPIENNIFDLWSIFDFLMPGYLSDLKTFKSKYESIETYQETVKVLTSPFILRRRKEDVLLDLPDKYEIIYTVDMTPGQRKIYEAYRLEMQRLLKDADKGHAIEMLSAITRLRQICVDPSMFVENYDGGSGKKDYLIELLNQKIPEGHRVLIFSQFVKALEDIEQELRKLGIKYFKITGETPAKERLDICNTFNNNTDVKVVLISLKAGGTGLNLVGADTVIHIDPWWNLAAQNQASDRAHRIGQTRAVEVIKLISENSIEQQVLDIQNEKKQLVELMIADNDEAIKKLSIEELKSLLISK